MERDRLKAEGERQNAKAEAIRNQRDDAPDKTAGAYNGRYWVRCPVEVKAGIVVGFNIAMQNPIISTESGAKFAADGTVGEMVKTLDNFYRREDVQIPIWMAMRLIKLHQDGASESEITAEWETYWRPVNPAK